MCAFFPFPLVIAAHRLANVVGNVFLLILELSPECKLPFR